MNTVRYIAYYIVLFVIMLVFVLGICVADASLGLCALMMGGSVAAGYFLGVGKMIDFIERYDTVCSYKTRN